MMLTLQVICIKKLDRYSRYESITHLGIQPSLLNPKKYWTKEEVIEAINKGNEFYIEVNGKKAVIMIVNGKNGPYLRADADNDGNNNLLELPECHIDS
jgi:hypothetical protein